MWQKIKKLEGRTLHTTVRNKPFCVVSVTNNHCIIRVESTGKVRPIPREDFQRAVDLGPISSLNTSILRDKGASEVNPTYVLSILKLIHSEE